MRDKIKDILQNKMQLLNEGIWENPPFICNLEETVDEILKLVVQPDVIKSVCDRCEGKPESADNVLCSDCYSDLHGM